MANKHSNHKKKVSTGDNHEYLLSCPVATPDKSRPSPLARCQPGSDVCWCVSRAGSLGELPISIDCQTTSLTTPPSRLSFRHSHLRNHLICPISSQGFCPIVLARKMLPRHQVFLLHHHTISGQTHAHPRPRYRLIRAYPQSKDLFRHKDVSSYRSGLLFLHAALIAVFSPYIRLQWIPWIHPTSTDGGWRPKLSSSPRLVPSQALSFPITSSRGPEARLA